MALDRADSSPGSHAPASGSSQATQPLGVSAAALQRYEEAVFCVTLDGRMDPANPVAQEFAARL